MRISGANTIAALRPLCFPSMGSPDPHNLLRVCMLLNGTFELSGGRRRWSLASNSHSHAPYRFDSECLRYLHESISSSRAFAFRTGDRRANYEQIESKLGVKCRTKAGVLIEWN